MRCSYDNFTSSASDQLKAREDSEANERPPILRLTNEKPESRQPRQEKYPSSSEVMPIAVESLRLSEAPDADTEESTI